jgi:phosphoenolpyruvate carboxykinase (ATP)
VKDAVTEKSVNWSKTNIPIDEQSYDLIEKIAIDYINHKGRCIVVDGYAGWDKNNRVKVRTYCTRTYHALFMRNMLIRPTLKETNEDFSRGVDINIFNAGEMQVSPNLPGLKSGTVTTLNLSQQKMIILGTQFAGEMKKSVFKILHYVYPRRGILSLHSSATLNPDGSSTIMCGLSATGKTALSLRSDTRKLIGDDEICWGDEGIFNIEGGVYAKIINLDKNVEPEIYNGIRFGAIVENANFHEGTRELNFNDISITPNSRTSFPLDYLKNVQLPAVGPHPKNIIFLTCDTKGVLPPVAKLTQEQAVYQFLSGYTAKIGGTDLSAKTP